MKKYSSLVLGFLVCVAVIAVGYFWATDTIASLYAYRSQLKDTPPQPLQPLGNPSTGRLVFILVDGLRVDTALDAAVMPNLARLRGEGASATIHSVPPSYSEPAYTTLLSGASSEISDGPMLNLDYEDIHTFTQDDLFSAAHRAGLKTAISGYYWFEKLVPQDAVDEKFYTPGEDNSADEDVVKAVLPWLKEGDAQFVLIHLDQVDYAGHHQGGPRDQRWNDAATRADAMIGQIAGTLDLSKDTVLILSDHGHIWIGGHGGQDPIVLVQPLVLAGKGVKPGQYGDINQVDIAPTLAALLGIAIPASSQGQVRTEMLDLPDTTLEKLPGYISAQLSALVDAYSKAVTGSPAGLQQSGLNPQTARVWMEQIRMQKLAPERMLRGVISFILFLIPLFFIIRKWQRAFLWYILGAFLMLFLFNLRYAWIDSRAYSLSSVSSQMDMILYSGITAAVAFAIAWLVVMLVTKGFKKGALGAASNSMLFALFTLYILAAVALVNFTLNGWKVTWTLPDFLAQFLGLIAVIVAIFIAASGLILAGVSALSGWLMTRRN